MAVRQSFEQLGITDGLKQLGPVDFLTPPPAVSANEITGIGEPDQPAVAQNYGFKMELGL